MKKLFLTLILISSSPLFSSGPQGTNNNGILIEAVALPESGEGYIHMYRESDRFWGTTQMINMIEATAKDMKIKYPGRDRLQIEDISQKNGGDIEGHASHENGQDVDIGYYKADGIEHDPIAKNQQYADSMVIDARVSPNFDNERNWALMKLLYRYADVQKIFIDRLLKNSLCNYAKKIGEYSNNLHLINSMQHIENHQDHLHVRIRCPKDAKKCVNQ